MRKADPRPICFSLYSYLDTATVSFPDPFHHQDPAIEHATFMTALFHNC